MSAVRSAVRPTSLVVPSSHPLEFLATHLIGRLTSPGIRAASPTCQAVLLAAAPMVAAPRGGRTHGGRTHGGRTP
jgi:hypothetical protein